MSNVLHHLLRGDSVLDLNGALVPVSDLEVSGGWWNGYLDERWEVSFTTEHLGSALLGGILPLGFWRIPDGRLTFSRTPTMTWSLRREFGGRLTLVGRPVPAI